LTKAGLRVETQLFDYQDDPVKALRAAEAAVATDVIAVIGYNWSSHALIAAPVHHAGKLPMITPSATADRLGTLGSYIHSACFDNSFMGRQLAVIAQEKLKAKSAALVTAANCAYCTDLARAFKEEFSRRGGRISAESPVLETATDFAAVAQAVRGAHADIVVIPNQELLSARIISALIQAGVAKPFLGGDGWGNVGEQFFGVLGGRSFAGYSLSHWHAGLADPRSRAFVAAYQARFHKAPNDTAVLAYDTTRLFVEALLRAQATGKPLSREAIEKALNELKAFEGVTGSFRYDAPNAAPAKSIVLLKAGAKFQIEGVIPPEGGRL
jgi:branched-chain amino acid transport system substrate-binding protein